jgi:hypothetical protein
MRVPFPAARMAMASIRRIAKLAGIYWWGPENFCRRVPRRAEELFQTSSQNVHLQQGRRPAEATVKTCEVSDWLVLSRRIWAAAN